MAENRIDIDIEADASEAESALDSLIKKLESLNGTLNNIGKNNGVKSLSSSANKITKEYQGIVDTTGKSISKASTLTNNSVKSMEGRLSELNEKYKDLGKDFEFSGSMDAVNREVERYQNALQKALVDKQELELAGKTEGDMYEKAVAKVQRYSNYIEALQKQQSQGTTNKRDINDESVLSADEEALFAPKDINVGNLTSQLESLKNWVDQIDYAFEDIKLSGELPSQIQLIETELSQARDVAENFQNLNMSDEFKQTEEVIKDLESQLEYANQLSEELPQSQSIDYDASEITSTFETANEQKREFNITPLKLATDFSNAYELQKYLDSLSTKIDSVQMKMAKLDSLGTNPNTQRYQGYVYDLQQMQTTIDSLTPELERLRNAGQLDINIPNLDGTQAKVSKLNTTLANMKVVIKTDELKQTEKELEQVQKRYEQIRQSIQLNMQANKNYGAGQTYKKQQVELEALRQQYSDLILKQEELSRAGGGGYSLNFSSLTSGANKFSTALKNAKLPKGLTSGLSKVKSLLTKLVPSTNSLSKGFKNLSKSSSNLLKPLTKVTKMLKLMVVRMALRQVIAGTQEGFQNLAQYSNVVNADLSLLMNSLNQLKNTFAATAAPILNVVTPALNYLIQVVISAMNYINQFISTLLGKSTWTKATALTEDYASSLSDTASAAGSAKDAVEDMLGLQGFDELNNLTTNDSSSGSGSGGSGSGTSASDMFTEEEIDNNIATLAESIKEMWENQDFEGIGTVISDKLTEMLNSIDWEKIYSVASNFGSGLAEFLNGLITPELFSALGNTIAGAINTALNFLDGFGDSFDFANFGNSIATGIVSALNGIQWETALSASQSWGRGIADALNSFLTEDLFTSVATTITSLITTAVQGALYLGTELKFDEIGSNLVSGLNTFFDTFPWTEIQATASTWASGVGEFFQSAVSDKDLWKNIGSWIASGINTVVKAGIDFSTSIDWEQLGEDIATSINQFFLDLNENDVAKFISSGINAIGDLIGGLISEIDLGDIILSIGSIVANLDTDAKITLATGFGVLLASKVVSALGTLALSEIKTKISSLVVSAIDSAISSGLATKIASALGTIGLSVTVAIVGFEIGKWLYNNVDIVQELSDDIAEWIFGSDGQNSTLEITLKTLSIAFGSLSIALTAAQVISAIVSKIGTKLAMSTILDISTSTITGADTVATKTATTLASKLATALAGSEIVSTVSSGLASLLTLAGEAAAVVGAAYIGWSLGNEIYEAVTGEEVDMTVGEQWRVIGEWIGEEISEGISSTVDTIDDWLDMSDSEGTNLTSENDLWTKVGNGDYVPYGIDESLLASGDVQLIYEGLARAYYDLGDATTYAYIQSGVANGIWEDTLGILDEATTSTTNWTAETEKNKAGVEEVTEATTNWTAEVEKLKATQSSNKGVVTKLQGEIAALRAETEKNKSATENSAAAYLNASSSANTYKGEVSETQGKIASLRAETEEIKSSTKNSAAEYLNASSNTDKYTSSVGKAKEAMKDATDVADTWTSSANSEKKLIANSYLNDTKMKTVSKLKNGVKSLTGVFSSDWKGNSATLEATTSLNGTTITTASKMSSALNSFNSTISKTWGTTTTASLNAETKFNGNSKTSTSSLSASVASAASALTSKWKGSSTELQSYTYVNGALANNSSSILSKVSSLASSLTSNWKGSSATLSANTKVNGTTTSSTSSTSAEVAKYQNAISGNWTGASSTLKATTKLNNSEYGNSSSIGTAVKGFSSSITGNWSGKTSTLNTKTEINGSTYSTNSGLSSKIKSLRDSITGQWTGKNMTLGVNATVSDMKKWINNNIIGQLNSGLTKIGFSSSSLIATLKAGGGYVDRGQLFIANEAGPEMVGKIGSENAVANNRQITDGIATAVANANQEGNTLTRQEIALLQRQNELLLGILEKETGISSSDIFSSVRKSASDYYKRTGNTAFPI